MERSTHDIGFLATIRGWLEERGELLVLRQYSRAAGSKDWYLVRRADQLEASLAAPPDTSITVLRLQLPIRGTADRALIEEACRTLPDGEWLFILRMKRREQFGQSYSVVATVESHAELWEALLSQDMNGYEVAIGREPPWFDDSDDVVEAIVPRSDGAVVRGIY